MSGNNGVSRSTNPAPQGDIEGIVAAVNERGIRIGEDWFNVSRFKPLELPAKGTRVRISVDLKGYLSTISVLEPPTATAPSARETTITRLAVLKAAAAFCASRPDAKAIHVTALADQWLAWVERE